MIIQRLIGILTGAQGLVDPIKAGLQQSIIGQVGQNWYPNKAPQGTPTPYGIVHQISGEHIVGTLGRYGQSSPRIGFTVYATEAATANKIGDLVRQLFDGFKGPTGAPPAPAILGCFLKDEGDDYLPPAHVDEIGIHSTPWNFLVVHNEN